MSSPKQQLEAILRDLRAEDDQEAQVEIGRRALSSLLHRHARDILDDVLKLARRDNRMRRCLSGARYYAGLNEAICNRIDEVLKHPFPGVVSKGKSR